MSALRCAVNEIATIGYDLLALVTPRHVFVTVFRTLTISS